MLVVGRGGGGAGGGRDGSSFERPREREQGLSRLLNPLGKGTPVQKEDREWKALRGGNGRLKQEQNQKRPAGLLFSTGIGSPQVGGFIIRGPERGNVSHGVRMPDRSANLSLISEEEGLLHVQSGTYRSRKKKRGQV